jgi:hypothetical protein
MHERHQHRSARKKARTPRFVGIGMFALTFLALGTARASAQQSAKPAAIDFNRDIRPLLSDYCFACHGPDEKQRKAKLRLDVREQAVERQAFVPGQPDQSELVARIFAADPSRRMPPPRSNKQLTPAQKDLLKRWIAQGAVYQKHWAYQLPIRHAEPAVRDVAWPVNLVDRFLLARMEQEGVRPAPEADRITLIRRVSFDLTGLPPTAAEVTAFLNDNRPDAWERVVDRLLASEAFGENLATYWLDLVRYADTVGYHGDQEHHISPYRDYVIDAFNDNLPFDHFTREQLAGDLLPPHPTLSPRGGEGGVRGGGVDQKIASGYNRLLQTSHEGGVQVKEYLAIYQADRVRNLSAVWLGGTMGCAQCHDHKFDPYTTKDFYALAAFFADLDEAQHLKKGVDASPTVRAPEIRVLTKRERARLADLQSQITKLGEQLEQLPPDSPQRQELEERKAAAEKERDAVQKSARLTMVSVAIEPRVVRVLPRGNWLDDSGPVVQPAVPEFLGRVNSSAGRATRLDLANWLVDPKEGVGLLTARVMANRFWYLTCGQGLSRSLEDFGGQGEPPSHPELLDRLAHEFATNWDVKAFLRLLVTSRAYRQSTTAADAGLRERDPENRLFAHQAIYRLSAEKIRDNALAISGLLVRQVGGPSVRPYQPEGYYQHLNFPKRTYRPDTDARQWRRGLYVHWQRQYLHPMLKAFDAPSREECTVQRPRSNTPQAALVLLNDPTFLEAARAFGERILREGGDRTEARLTYAFRRATSRTPDDLERKLLTDLLEKNRQAYTANPEAARALVRTGLAPVPKDLDTVEWAAWTAVARALLNLSETNTRP